MQTYSISFQRAVHFGSKAVSPEQVRADLEKLLKDKAGLEPATTKVFLENDPMMVEILGGPTLMVYGNPSHDDASDQRILTGMKKLAKSGLASKGEREFEYKGLKVTVPAPRRLM